MPSQPDNSKNPLPVTTTVAVLLIMAATGAMLAFLILSAFSLLGRTACTVVMVAGLPAIAVGYHRMNGGRLKPAGIRLRRFRHPFALLYAVCAAASAIGGAIHLPNNHDALSYRVPRILHWLAEGQWHWIGGADTRMDFSGIGYEVLLLPVLGALHTLRVAYLANLIGYLLLPGLIYQVLSSLGVRKNIAATWMWIIPCGSCFVMQAGSLGNDLPGATLLLASLAFALKARSTGGITDLWLAMLAAALMTGMKASNLPLLLPTAICMLAALARHPRMLLPNFQPPAANENVCSGAPRPSMPMTGSTPSSLIHPRHPFPATFLVGLMALAVSFAPLAIWNARHTGDWTGQPGSPLKLQSPAAGLAGNAILIGSAALAPAVFPQAEAINSGFDRFESESLGWIRERFPDMRMTHPQLASEENSGIGLGVTAALLLGMAGGLRGFKWRRLISLGGLVFIGSLGALLFFMMKLGNCGAPRLIMPYYAGAVGLMLLLFDSGTVFRARWWKVASLLLLLPIVPALLFGPARPLLPMRAIMNALIDRGIDHPMVVRMATVYEVYANRHDPYTAIREMLPANATRIAFAGTAGDSEYSFWLPLGTRRVVDFQPDSNGKPPEPGTFDAIVTSTWGSNDRFGMTPEQLAESLGWEITDSAEVQTLASLPPAKWSIITPPSKDSP